jgi:hypothetical protein
MHSSPFSNVAQDRFALMFQGFLVHVSSTCLLFFRLHSSYHLSFPLDIPFAKICGAPCN